MKKKVISFIGLALFIGAVAFNVQMTNSNKQGSEVILKNIEVIASGGDSGNCLLGGVRDCPLWPNVAEGEWYWVPNPYD